MKKIVFMVINMNIGGTEKALLNMINEMPKDQYDITVLMLEKYGGFLDAIPKEVKVEYLQDYATYKQLLNRPVKTTVMELIKQGKIVKSIALGCVHTLSKIFINKMFYYNYILKTLPVYKNNYDVAIAYAGPMDFISYFVAKKINAEKKIQWIHFDVTKIGFNKRLCQSLYKKFNKIYVVSNEGKNKLVSKIPSIRGKTEVFNNIVSEKSVLLQSNLGVGFKDNFDGIRILTVGRLSKEKGQDMAIKVLSRLINEGYNVKWYCLGEGAALEAYQKLVTQYNLENHFIFLGADPNPYPYIRRCDIYVQPSRHEGYCITLAEAKCLLKPIVSASFTGANEQIINNETGLVVEGNIEEIYQGVKSLIINPQKRKKFSEGLNNEKALQQKKRVFN
ncbi:glycosyltransferase [Rossellomorea sp. DA94]|uniref:glycosyltransferase n=1 Tax=Rossellomorea sp. DA94 TaxID=3038653 RepID=UPI00244ACBE2|nr:glycosyltransferase [Rossellomorea sp. DA94]WGG45871.1 glycosyltransferase [Rossellomorea sp. DA94]